MNFDYTEEQNALRDTLTRFIAKDYPFEARRALAKTAEGFSRDHWSQFAELGLLALPFPDACEGLNGNAVDNLVVMEAFGRGLVLEPYFATVILAGHLLRDFASDEQKRALLPKIGSGERMLALGHYEADARYELARIATTVTPQGSGFRLSGQKAVVLSGGCADQFLISARSAGGSSDAQGLSLFLVDRHTPGLKLSSYSTQDGGRAAELVLDQVEVGAQSLVGSLGEALPAIERALDYGIAALCAESVGIMGALNEATLEYLKTRKQFGQA
ncbi:partial pimeloyl-CoA dehydrogenase, partial [Planctomycetaceae bacterium]